MDNGKNFDQEWVNLILEARKKGIPIGDIRLFLTQKTSFSPKQEEKEEKKNLIGLIGLLKNRGIYLYN